LRDFRSSWLLFRLYVNYCSNEHRHHGYPSYGGSGIVGSELGRELALRGHTVHFISSSLPTRLVELSDKIQFHEVEMMSYPLFEHQPYGFGVGNENGDGRAVRKLGFAARSLRDSAFDFGDSGARINQTFALFTRHYDASRKRILLWSARTEVICRLRATACSSRTA
jgi:hypothetical protein